MAAADVLHLTGRVATELSGGERARVLLARALSVEAPVLIIDEPLAALDPGHQLQTMALLRRLAGEGRLVMVVMHDLGMASRFCDRMLLLSEGRLAEGRSEEHTSELQSLMRISYAVFCLKKKKISHEEPFRTSQHHLL